MTWDAEIQGTRTLEKKRRDL